MGGEGLTPETPPCVRHWFEPAGEMEVVVVSSSETKMATLRLRMKAGVQLPGGKNPAHLPKLC